MYLSRLVLNPRSRDVRRDLAGHQDLHRTVLAMFPALPEDAGVTDARGYFGVLHRVDVDTRTGKLTLLVQSHEAPDFSRLPGGYLVETGGDPVNPDQKSLDKPYAAFRPGVRLAFRLRANPTRKIDTKSGPDGRRRNGKRVDLRSEAECWQWLARKGQDAGFCLLTVRTHRPVEIDPHRGGPLPARCVVLSGMPDVNASAAARLWGKGAGRERRSRDSRGNALTFASVLFEGILEVVDAERFRAALEAGIGSGKAYGFGLLSIAPATAGSRL